MPFVLILTMQSLRFLWILRRFGNMVGEFLVLSTPVICVASALLSVPAHTSATVANRSEIEESLMSSGPRALVIVHYDPDHVPADEWVYNAADIDRARVVWARDMGIERNRELAQYFKDRKVWILHVGRSSTQLVPDMRR